MKHCRRPHGRDRATQTAKGVAPPDVDAQIAPIALAHDAAVATRNADDFRRQGETIGSKVSEATGHLRRSSELQSNFTRVEVRCLPSQLEHANMSGVAILDDGRIARCEN